MLGAKLVATTVEKLKDAQARQREHEPTEVRYLLTEDCDDPQCWVCEERRRIEHNNGEGAESAEETVDAHYSGLGRLGEDGRS